MFPSTTLDIGCTHFIKVVSVIIHEAEVKDAEDTIGEINSVGAENAYSFTERFARDEDIRTVRKMCWREKARINS